MKARQIGDGKLWLGMAFTVHTLNVAAADDRKESRAQCKDHDHDRTWVLAA